MPAWVSVCKQTFTKGINVGFFCCWTSGSSSRKVSFGFCLPRKLLGAMTNDRIQLSFVVGNDNEKSISNSSSCFEVLPSLILFYFNKTKPFWQADTSSDLRQIWEFLRTNNIQPKKSLLFFVLLDVCLHAKIYTDISISPGDIDDHWILSTDWLIIVWIITWRPVNRRKQEQKKQTGA